MADETDPCHGLRWDEAWVARALFWAKMYVQDDVRGSGSGVVMTRAIAETAVLGSILNDRYPGLEAALEREWYKREEQINSAA